MASAAGSAYTLLVRSLVRIQPPGTPWLDASGTGFKGVASLVGYLPGIPLAFVLPWLSFVIYVGVAVIWFIQGEGWNVPCCANGARPPRHSGMLRR